jgi:aspartate 1-decarboxylase
MMRQFLLAKIHRCVVTRADLNYQGSVTLDRDLMEAAGFLENERVEVTTASPTASASRPT